MASEYDPAFERSTGATDDDLDSVQERFADAAGPYLANPVPWLVWGLALPAAALATRPTLAAAGPRGALLLWSLTILAAGAVEVLLYSRRRSRRPRSTLAAWALRLQGNLSATAAALSIALLWVGEGWLLPALWLLLLGHSLYGLGGLAFQPLRTCGLVYQLGGLVALVPAARTDLIFALTTGLGSLWVAASIARHRREDKTP